MNDNKYLDRDIPPGYQFDDEPEEDDDEEDEDDD
jgi:hypothetical protein